MLILRAKCVFILKCVEKVKSDVNLRIYMMALLAFKERLLGSMKTVARLSCQQLQIVEPSLRTRVPTYFSKFGI